jgi:chromosome segregation ATPase
MTDAHEKSFYTHTKLWKTNKKDLITLFRQLEWELLDLGGLNIKENLVDDIAVFEAEEFKMKNTINELKETIEKLLKRTKFLEDKNESQKKGFNQLEAYYSEPQQKEIDKLNKDIDGMVIDIENLKDKNQLLNQELETVRDKDMTWQLCRKHSENAIQEATEKLKEENEKLKEEIEDLNDQCMNKNEDNEDLEEKLELHGDFIDNFINEYTALRLIQKLPIPSPS